jgi:hypothetical protein
MKSSSLPLRLQLALGKENLLGKKKRLILLCSFEQSSHVEVEVHCLNFMPFGWMQYISCSGGYK